MMLIKSGARLNVDGNALYVASAKGYRTIVAKLLNYGAAPNRDGEFGKSALEAAIQGGHSDVLQLLLQNSAIFDRVSSTGLNLGGSALHMAARDGHRDLLEWLLQRPKVNAYYQDKDGLSSLLIAVSQDHEAIVRLLLKAGRYTTSTSVRVQCELLKRS